MRTRFVVLLALLVAAISAGGTWKAYLRLHRAPPAFSGADVRVEAILSQADQFAPEVILVGDSLVELAWLPGICRLPTLNAGVGGAKIEHIAALLRLLAGRTRSQRIIIAAGVNDAVRGRSTSVEAFRSSYAEALTLARGMASTVQVVEIGPVAAEGTLGMAHFDPSRIDTLNAAIRDLGAPALSLHSLANESGHLPNDKTTDGVHFNRAGYESWGAIVGRACS